MPHGLRRFQQSRQTHFVTFTCYHRRVGFVSAELYDLFVQILERMRLRFDFCVYGYVVMPNHVHLLMSEPERGLLADAIHDLKLSLAKTVGTGVFWQKRYYDRNVRNEREFKNKLRYVHRNPGSVGRVPQVSRFSRPGMSGSYHAKIPRCALGAHRDRAGAATLRPSANHCHSEPPAGAPSAPKAREESGVPND
jgi:putative transposase